MGAKQNSLQPNLIEGHINDLWLVTQRIDVAFVFTLGLVHRHLP